MEASLETRLDRGKRLVVRGHLPCKPSLEVRRSPRKRLAVVEPLPSQPGSRARNAAWMCTPVNPRRSRTPRARTLFLCPHKSRRGRSQNARRSSSSEAGELSSFADTSGANSRYMPAKATLVEKHPHVFMRRWQDGYKPSSFADKPSSFADAEIAFSL